MLMINKDEIKQKELFPGFTGRFVHSEHLTVVHWSISAGSNLPEHSHPHEQITSIISGEFDFTIAGKTKKLTSGGIAIIPSDAQHSGNAITDCYVIDVFYPVREDYKI